MTGAQGSRKGLAVHGAQQIGNYLMARVGSIWIGDTKTDLFPIVVMQYEVTFVENAVPISSTFARTAVINLCARVTIH